MQDETILKHNMSEEVKGQELTVVAYECQGFLVTVTKPKTYFESTSTEYK